MGAAKGHAKWGGRKKGDLNKHTYLLKDAIFEAANIAGGGGDNGEGLIVYLTSQAVQNPSAFLSLLGKILPAQIVGDPDNPIEMFHRIERVIIDASDIANQRTIEYSEYSDQSTQYIKDQNTESISSSN